MNELSLNDVILIAESRIELYFVQSLQLQKVAEQIAKRAYCTLQPPRNLSRETNAKQIARKTVQCNTNFSASASKCFIFVHVERIALYPEIKCF